MQQERRILAKGWVGIAGTVLAFSSVWFSTGQARELDLSKPEDARLASHRIVCGTQKPGHFEYGVWRGKIFGRVPWEADRHLFDIVGVNTRRCPTIVDPERGTGYRLVSREFMLYLEPGTNNKIETWNNPYTGETLKVEHLYNDPVNFPPQLPYGRDGTPYTFPGEIIGDFVVRNLQAKFYMPYPHPLGSGNEKSIGGFHQGMEIYTHFVPKAELLTDSETPVQNLLLAWHRFSNWSPWMQMGDIPGTLISSTYGWRVKKIEDLPQLLQDAINTDFKLFREPPPADDTRGLPEPVVTYLESLAKPAP